LERKTVKNQNYIKDHNLNCSNKIDIKEPNNELEIDKNAIQINNFSVSNNKNILIKKLKVELSQVLFEDNDKTFKNEGQANYINYFISQFLCCFEKEKKKMFDFEVNRAEKLLNFETFQHYLTESYAVKYRQIKE
jgi:hypothetical protein